MGVSFQQFGGGGGGTAAVTAFSDPLTGPSGSMGKNWANGIWPISPVNAPISWENFQLGVGSDGPQALIVGFLGQANPNTVLPGYAMPVPVIVGDYGLTQFAQITWVSANGIINNADFGLGVMCRADEDTGYYIDINTRVANQTELLRLKQSSGTLLGAGGFANPIAGDIYRISADLSVAGQVTITGTKNGVVFQTFVDNTANRLTVGSPALRGVMGSGNYQVRTFSCGLGL